ncbi:unnamed protein product [Effrenium voratum]|nr:unnamed protein product [Effrenium voratum]
MFMLERRGEDARCENAQQLQPGSPRLQEETGADDLALREDDALEVTEWRRSRPYGTEVKKEGWSKGFKRNLACALAKGAYLVNMEDGCLYAEDYLAFMRQELSAASAVVPQCWHTVALAHQSFRSVDLKNREDELQELPENERLGYGFCQGFLRSAWLKQPFPDKEGPQDRRFMEALRSEGLAPHLVRPTRALAAYGWWQHSAGAKDAPTNINMYSELLMLACRGRGLEKPPEAFEPLLPHVKRATEAYASKRELRLKRMLDTEGTVHLSAATARWHCRSTGRTRPPTPTRMAAPLTSASSPVLAAPWQRAGSMTMAPLGFQDGSGAWPSAGVADFTWAGASRAGLGTAPAAAARRRSSGA